MANWHARESNEDGNTIIIVFHVPIPVETNQAGLGLRDALARSPLRSNTVMAEGTGQGLITAAEKAQLAAGELFEFVQRFDVNPNLTATQTRDLIDARYTQLATAIPARLRKALAYFGFDRNVP
jgi:hypothetical protein